MATWWSGSSEFLFGFPECGFAGQQRDKPTSAWRWEWRLVSRAVACASPLAASLVHELIEARDEKRLLRYQKHLVRQELLIVDERGFVPLSKAGAEMLFEVFSQRTNGPQGS
jgi:hypothetical protein